MKRKVYDGCVIESRFAHDKCAKVAERLRNRLQSDSIPVRIRALAFIHLI